MKPIPKEIRKKVYDMFDGHCAYCGKKIKYEEMQVDHIQSIYRGCDDDWFDGTNVVRGKDDISNYFPSCRSCNFRKGTFNVEDFRKQLIEQKDNIVKRSFQVRQSIDYGLLVNVDKPIVFYFETHKKNI